MTVSWGQLQAKGKEKGNFDRSWWCVGLCWKREQGLCPTTEREGWGEQTLFDHGDVRCGAEKMETRNVFDMWKGKVKRKEKENLFCQIRLMDEVVMLWKKTKRCHDNRRRKWHENKKRTKGKAPHLAIQTMQNWVVEWHLNNTVLRLS